MSELGSGAHEVGVRVVTEGLGGAEDAVLRITIDRPDRNGALGLAQQYAFVAALEEASTSDTVRVIVIDSVGDHFCAGADVVAANASDKGDSKPRPGSLQRRTPLQAHRIIELLHQIQLPVVSVVRGWAAGLGCEIALASDFAVAADDARFWLPFTKRGFTPDSGSTWLLPRLIGIARAKEMLMLGRPVTGADAATWGMIYRSAPAEEIDTTAAALVAELAAAPTVALGLTKHCIHEALTSTLGAAMAAESMALELSSRTADFREGIAAFSQRRDPRFEGR